MTFSPRFKINIIYRCIGYLISLKKTFLIRYVEQRVSVSKNPTTTTTTKG